jgi:hypothetical protein
MISFIQSEAQERDNRCASYTTVFFQQNAFYFEYKEKRNTHNILACFISEHCQITFKKIAK